MTSTTPRTQQRVMVAMSGGVDSSTTAALLVERGYDVLGVHMSLWDYSEEMGAGTCCAPADAQDARRVAETLGIPFYVVNYRRQFREHVVEYFVREYQNGRTPNPCLKCNESVKFTDLLTRARELGATLATGHYARIQSGNGADGPYTLRRSVARAKDQTYFLFSLTQRELSHIMFPLGAMTKPEVRAHAERFNLPVSNKPDSQDICFVGKRKAGEFVAEYADGGRGTMPGDIVDHHDAVIGRHKGLIHYTVGQRKGLGISNETPLYVIRCDVQTNRIHVGPLNVLGATELTAAAVSWVDAEHAPCVGERVDVQIRYRTPPVSARLLDSATDGFRLRFDEPQRAVTPGQAVVLYHGDTVLGGGYIESGNLSGVGESSSIQRVSANVATTKAVTA